MTSLKKNIGLLGGTFDPPHQGHLSISKHSLIKLGLDEVWWIVSKKNPLKKENSKYELRLAETKKFLYSQKIKVFEVNDELENIYTIDLIMYLKKKFPKFFFIWLMGADNLKQFHLWKDWRKIFYNIPIAIFDRPFYSLDLLQSKAFSFFRNKRIDNKYAKSIKYMIPPKWVFLTGINNPQSSTNIRLNKK